jgi:hypothetical protein
MATYVEISRQDMLEFLQSLAFKPLDPTRIYNALMRPEQREVVYGRLENAGKMQVTIRVFTSLPAVEGAPVRKKGADAIRVLVVGRDFQGKVHPVSKPRRVFRVEGWKKNLQAAIDGWPNQIKYRCFQCSSPMTFHEMNKRLYCSFCAAEKAQERVATASASKE